MRTFNESAARVCGSESEQHGAAPGGARGRVEAVDAERLGTQRESVRECPSDERQCGGKNKKTRRRGGGAVRKE